jgi:hypothetical protein
MDALRITEKGGHMNTLEKIYIYIEAANNGRVEDVWSVKAGPLCDTPV